MKKIKIGIIISLIIVVVSLILISNQDQLSENTIISKITESTDNSAYFQIDKTQYNIGEKIFLDVDGMNSNDKGVVLFLRPINDTHRTTYIAIPFDGDKKSAFNYYVEPRLNEDEGICSTEDLAGIWSIVFYETNYSNIEFEVKNQISDWDDRTFEPVC